MDALSSSWSRPSRYWLTLRTRAGHPWWRDCQPRDAVQDRCEQSLDFSEPFRTVAVLLATVYLLGLVVLIWAPETKGRPLPTDDDDQ